MLCVCVLPVIFLELPFRLFFGWVFFLADAVPRTSFSVVGLISAVACLAALTLILRQVLRRMTAASVSGQPTSWKSTLRLVVIPILLFAAGTGFVGIASSSIWLTTTNMPLVESGRSAAKRAQSKNNLKQIGIDFFGYKEKTGALPPGGTFDETGRGLHGWTTHLLPYMNEAELFERVNWDEPWQSPANRPVMQTVLPFLLSPGIRGPRRGPNRGFAVSHYAANVRVLGPNSHVRFRDISDGTSNTILAGEVSRGIRPWGDPLNWRDPTAGINKPNGFGMWKGGCHVLMADGTVRFLTDNISQKTLRQLSDPADGEEVGDF